MTPRRPASYRHSPSRWRGGSAAAWSGHGETMRKLAQVDAQLNEARAELAQLRLELTRTKQALSDSRMSALREANESLLLTALEAQRGADAARSDFNSLLHASQRDYLTGLPNRALMRDRPESAISMAHRRGTHLAVMFVDIDGFKLFNDTNGHLMGDSVLLTVARCLNDVVRHSDTVSREGGDEFLVLLAEVTAATDAAQVAGKIQSEINEAGTTNHPSFSLSASIGIALFPEHGTDAATLIVQADTAMYRAQKAGGARFEFYVPPIA